MVSDNSASRAVSGVRQAFTIVHAGLHRHRGLRNSNDTANISVVTGSLNRDNAHAIFNFTVLCITNDATHSLAISGRLNVTRCIAARDGTISHPTNNDTHRNLLGIIGDNGARIVRCVNFSVFKNDVANLALGSQGSDKPHILSVNRIYLGQLIAIDVQIRNNVTVTVEDTGELAITLTGNYRSPKLAAHIQVGI